MKAAFNTISYATVLLFSTPPSKSRFRFNLRFCNFPSHFKQPNSIIFCAKAFLSLKFVSARLIHSSSLLLLIQSASVSKAPRLYRFYPRICLFSFVCLFPCLVISFFFSSTFSPDLSFVYATGHRYSPVWQLQLKIYNYRIILLSMLEFYPR